MWAVDLEVAVGRAGDFHAREVPDVGPEDRRVHIWWFEPAVEALVLGSTQTEGVVDLDMCRHLGIDVVRRRSGGGLVHLTREGTLWLDVVIPVEHPLWIPDVTASANWLGDVWIDALSTVGVRELNQHRSRLERTATSDLICFAGRGPGEVFLASGSKVVGISQRRTRTHARFQCAVSITWDPGRLVQLLIDPKPDLGEIEIAGSTLDLDRDELVSVTTKLLIERLAV